MHQLITGRATVKITENTCESVIFWVEATEDVEPVLV